MTDFNQESSEFPIKTRRVLVTNKRTGVKYVEERQYRYDPAKGYNVVISNRRTGEKILPGQDEPVRCRPMGKSQNAPKAQQETPDIEADRTRTGAVELLNHAGKISGLESAVRAAYPDGGTAEKLLSLAQYLVATGDTVHNVDAWQCEHDLPYEEGLSEDICYALFEELGRNETGTQSLFEKLARVACTGGTPVVAFDSTSHSTYSDGLKPYVRQGFNKDKDHLDIYKLTSFFSLDSGLPVSFEIQPGNIPDITSLENAITRAKVLKIGAVEFCLDNGFFSKENTCRFLRKNMKFTILATLTDEWIYKNLNNINEDGHSLRDDFDKYASKCPFDKHITAVSTSAMTTFSWTRQRTRNNVSAGSKESKEFRLYFHYFRDKSRALHESDSFFEKLDRIENTIRKGQILSDSEEEFAKQFFTWKRVRGGTINVTPDEQAIALAQKDFGIFAILSNQHSNAWDALRIYRRRNDIEESYRMIKSELDGRRSRVWSLTNLRGKELCRHIALGYRYALLKLLRNTQDEADRLAEDETLGKEAKKQNERLASWAKGLTVKKMLDWFDCVERVTVKNKKAQMRWSTETTRRDKAFLDLFYDKNRWV